MLVFSMKIQASKDLILYDTTNGIIVFKKHVLSYHSKIAKVFEKEVNNSIKEELERQPAKKRPNLFSVVIFKFFATKDPFKKDDV